MYGYTYATRLSSTGYNPWYFKPLTVRGVVVILRLAITNEGNSRSIPICSHRLHEENVLSLEASRERQNARCVLLLLLLYYSQA